MIDIPEVLDYHIPNRVYSVNFSCFDECSHLDEPIVFKYNAYVVWCMIQCYWYYCISQPQVTDELYDAVVQFIKDCEDTCPGDFNESWSPVPRNGSPGKWKSCSTHYPKFIQDMFEGIKHEFRMQWKVKKFINMKQGMPRLEKKLNIPFIKR